MNTIILKGSLAAFAGLSLLIVSMVPVGAYSFAYESRPNEPLVEPEVVKDLSMSLKVEGSSEDNTINLKWNALGSEAPDFDYYKVIYNKGSFNDLGGKSVSVAYVSLRSFSLIDLGVGHFWTFQVVPVKLKGSEYMEVTARSNVVKVQVKGDVEVEKKFFAPLIFKPISEKVLTNVDRRANLSWRNIDGAAYYEIRMGCKGCDGNDEGWGSLVTYVSVSNEFTTPALSGDHFYRFRVRAVSENGEPGSWSEFRYFSYDTSDVVVKNHPSLQVGMVNFLGIFPMAGWSKYEGTFNGYAVFLAEGNLAHNVLIETKPRYFPSFRQTYRMFNLKGDTEYSLEVVPYVNVGINKKLILGDRSNVLHFETD